MQSALNLILTEINQQYFVACLFQLAQDFDIVVNCSGVNAYHLVNDKEVIPIRGQLIKVSTCASGLLPQMRDKSHNS